MKKIICKGKYYKANQANPLLGHINRSFKNNKNAFPQLTKDNFGHDDLFNRFTSIKKKAEHQKEQINKNNKSFKKNSNLLFDNVVVFNREHTDWVISKIGLERFKAETTKRLNAFGKAVEQEFGLTYLGFNFHMDEGHSISPNEDRSSVISQDQLNNNYHAHCVFFNYDFQTGKQNLRTLTRASGFTSRLQDLVYDYFRKLGYKRGEKKVNQCAEQTQKIDHLRREEERLKQELENQKSKLNAERAANIDTPDQDSAIEYDLSVLDFLNNMSSSEPRNKRRRSRKPR